MFLLVFVIIAAAFLRLYDISSYMEFLGDEGRDVIVARNILHGQLTLLGPRSSAGDFYMGPFYYYLITPFLWIFNYDPVGPAVMVALFGVATVFLVYFVGKKFFGYLAGIIAAGLYAVSPLVLSYSHSSWNPDILPFFSLLLVYTIYLSSIKSKNTKYLLLSGIILGICLQLHYLSLFLAVIIFVYLLFVNGFKFSRNSVVHFLKQYGLILSGAIFSLLPFILFEFRHDFLNSRGIMTFLFGNTVSYATDTNFFMIVLQVFYRLFARLVFDFPTPANTVNFSLVVLVAWGICAMLLSIFSIIVLFKSKSKQIKLLLGLWLFLSVFLFGFYKKEIYDYLFTFIFPLPFLLIGNMFSKIIQFAGKKKGNFLPVLWSGIFLIIVLFVIDLSDLPFRNEPNHQRDQAKLISQFVLSKTNNKPYNFALLSKGNSDHAYRYYLEILGRPPVMLENLENDPERKTVTGQLLIVCEDIQCKPLGNSLHDVAAFGRADVVGEWNVSVVKVYKLVPYKTPKS